MGDLINEKIVEIKEKGTGFMEDSPKTRKIKITTNEWGDSFAEPCDDDGEGFSGGV